MRAAARLRCRSLTFESSPQAFSGGFGIFFRERLLKVVLHGHALEQAADDIEHLVGLELLADLLELVEQRLQNPSLARASRHQVDDDHWIVLLPVPVDASHPLLEPRRVPGHVVVHHQPAELQIDALARGVGGHKVIGSPFSCGPAEELNLSLALLVRHAAMDRCDLAGVAEAFEPAHQEVCCIACLSILCIAPVIKACVGARRRLASTAICH